MKKKTPVRLVTVLKSLRFYLAGKGNIRCEYCCGKSTTTHARASCAKWVSAYAVALGAWMPGGGHTISGTLEGYKHATLIPAAVASSSIYRENACVCGSGAIPSLG